jgi:DNA replication and repair protein RecF
MHVAAVETRGFRNLADLRVELGPAVAVLHGPNGAGKTNLLEAIYFGLAARSFRTGNDRDMIAFEEPSARVELELGGEDSTLLAALDRNGERRHVLDGRPLRGAGERPLVSVFHPDRMELVKGPAARRRGHLDRVVGALWPARADLRSRFGRTLAQRNALASRVRAGHASPSSLRTWDERLAAEAVPLIESRAEAVETLSGPVLEAAASLGLAEVELRYRPRADPDADAIAAELERRRDEELTGRPSSASRPGGLGRAYTTYGPQLDEVEMRSAGRPLRRFGSQGQQRAALLALLFGERSALIAAGRPAPLMLLDDVMSELDPERRELLVATLAGAGQAVITATEQRQVPSSDGLRSLGVREGRVLAAEPGESRAA